MVGHTAGLGLALTKALIDEGYNVVGIARRLSPLSSEHITSVQIDLASPSEVQSLLDQLLREQVEPSVFAYCAGVLSGAEVGAVDAERLAEVFQVNVLAAMVLESGLAGTFRSSRTDIVNVTSSSIREYYPLLLEYSSSKAALAKFTSDLRRALSGSGCRVIDLCPSGFTSEMYSSMKGQQIDRDESIQIDPDHIADFIVRAIHYPRRLEVGRIEMNRLVDGESQGE